LKVYYGEDTLFKWRAFAELIARDSEATSF